MNKEEEEFNLWKLSNKTLDSILFLDEKELEAYIHTLIVKFYKHTIEDEKMYKKLIISYKSSFVAEKFYRSNIEFQRGFQTIYTKTGIIRDVVNDLYFNDDSLITH